MITKLTCRDLRREVVVGDKHYVLELRLTRDGEPELEVREKRKHRGAHFNIASAIGRLCVADRKELPQLSFMQSLESPRMESPR